MIMVQTRNERLTAKRRQWENHIRQWEASGLSQAEYCRRHNLKIKNFVYRKARLKDKVLLELVEIPADPVYGSCVLKLNIGPQFQIEIPDGFSSASLGKVLLTLKSL